MKYFLINMNDQLNEKPSTPLRLKHLLHGERSRTVIIHLISTELNFLLVIHIIILKLDGFMVSGVEP